MGPVSALEVQLLCIVAYVLLIPVWARKAAHWEMRENPSTDRVDAWMFGVLFAYLWPLMPILWWAMWRPLRVPADS